jgi:hypothetical protein
MLFRWVPDAQVGEFCRWPTKPLVADFGHLLHRFVWKRLRRVERISRSRQIDGSGGRDILRPERRLWLSQLAIGLPERLASICVSKRDTRIVP